MKVLKPENFDYFSSTNGNQTIQENGVCELLKLNSYPIIIQFDNAEDVLFFANQVLKCNF